MRRTAPADEAAILTAYSAGEQVTTLAARFGICVKTVYEIRQRHGVPPRHRRANYVRGPQHPLFGTGRQYMHGYVRLWLDPGDPFYAMATRKGHVLEHRLLMARSIGRPLRRDETVHHKNGIRDDNRIENLELWQGNHGRGSRHRCADCGSTNVEAY